MAERFLDSLSSSQETSSLRRGIKLKNAALTDNVLISMIKQLEKGQEAAASLNTNVGVCSLIEQLFSIFRESKSIVLHSLIVLNYFISLSGSSSCSAASNPTWKHLLTHSDSCATLLSAIASHLADEEIISEGVRLLLSLTSEDSLLNKLLYHQSVHTKSIAPSVTDNSTIIGIANVLARMMKLRITDTRVMEQICHIIYNLTYEDDESFTGGCRSLLSELGVSDMLICKVLNVKEAESPIASVNFVEHDMAHSSKSELEKTVASSTKTAVSNNRISTIGNSREYSLTVAENDPASSVRSKKLNCLDIGLTKWVLRAVGALCRNHSDNQQIFFELGACEVVMKVRNLGT